MDTYEQRLAAWEAELREKYSDKDRQALAKNGEAMPDGSYPIADREDLDNAIHAVGRGGASHDAIRKHIIARAGALGLSKLVPDNWNSDGSLKQMNSASRVRKPRHRAVPMMPEVRHWATTGIEVRSASKTDEIIITGTPIVYGTPYAVRDMFGEFQETMVPGVARDVLANGADVRFLFNHDGLPLARSTSGTLSLNDGAHGLAFEARLDARQQLANDLAIAIERGDVSQMSCGFIVARDEWDDAMEDRTIHAFADLLDVSAVTYPASPTTSIQVAHRMVEQMPVESRERLRKLYAVTRAGKVLSSANQSKLEAAHEAIAAVLDAATPKVDNDGDIDSNSSVVRHPDGSEDAPNVNTNPDATEGGSAAGDSSYGSQGVLDATGSRSEDPEVETRDEVAEVVDLAKISRARAAREWLEARERQRKRA